MSEPVLLLITIRWDFHTNRSFTVWQFIFTQHSACQRYNSINLQLHKTTKWISKLCSLLPVMQEHNSKWHNGHIN